ncbi:hypothetical protein ABIA32_005417 [Streptacidiphilus sp. MAP12-20]|uniref:serine hydrolase n=1 Tax=Streptacidiphilus sp. MAP12-20 TaxID=3156299 RepID=UPI0035175290
MASPLRARARRALAAGIGTAALAALVPLGLAQPAAAASVPICSSHTHPALAAKLSRDIASAVAGRTDRYALNVWDAKTGVYCALHAYSTFDSASVVKATIMGAVLRRAQEQHRYLTSWEISNLRPMIENSDNSAASNLWNDLGRTRLNNFLRLVGMNYTTLGPGGYWGLTQITARDEMHLLDAYTDRTDVLTPNSKAFGLSLMAHVESDQRWGTPYGTPPGVVAHNKNGWLQRSFGDWRVHSIGVFTGNGKNYRMTVLTDNESSMDYGVTTIERIAWAVHHDLGTYNGKAATPYAPRVAGPQPGADTPLNPTSDGSVPFDYKG